MKRVKGCLNSSCGEYKKTYYKEADEFCVKCGTKLSYVCKHKNCWKQLPNDSKEDLCPVHLAERQDRNDRIKDGIKKVGAGLTLALGTAVTIGKAIVDSKTNK